MKKITILSIAFFVLIYSVSFSQDKFIQKKGHVWFFSHTPMEDVEAHNNESAMVLDTKTGDVTVQLLMKSFKFKKALMEEHFNENYIESAKFPKGEFKGKITNMKDINFSKDGSYKALSDGKLTMHGVTKDISITGNIEVKDGKIMVKSKFTVILQDYSIAIPDLVKDKIAKNMDVTIDIALDPYKK